VTRSFCIDEIPVYAKAGAIIPMQSPGRRSDAGPVDPLILCLFPGDSGAARVYEDEGDNSNYKTGQFSFTPVRSRRSGGGTTIVIDPVEGRYPGMPERRSYELRLVRTFPPRKVTIDGRVARYSTDPAPGTWSYDGDDLATRVFVPEGSIRRKVEVQVTFPDRDSELLSGRKGMFSRLGKFMKFLARNNWDKSKYSNDTVVRAAQTGHRIGLDPSRAPDQIQAFQADWRETLKMIEECSLEKWNYTPYLDLLNASNGAPR
jgi:alpha-glucosidase